MLELEARKERIPVQVTADEKRRFERVANSRHTTVSELIRQLMHAEADKLEKGKAA